jgi:predicted MFS family arabinose efflux permease
VFFASLLVYGFAVLLRPLADAFGWSRQTVSMTYAVMAITTAVAAPFLGTLLDRFGPVRIVVPCVAICGCGLASLALLTASPVRAYLTFAVLGIAGIGTSPLAYSRAVSSWFDRRRGLALSLVISGGAIASMTHPPVIEWLIRTVGWRSACLAIGSVMLAVGVPTVLTFVRERAATGAAVQARDDATIGGAVRSWVFWLLMAVIGAASISTNAVIVHLSALLTDRGIPSSLAALALSMMGASSLLGRLLAGWCLDRFHGPFVSTALLTIAGSGTLLLAEAPTFAVAVVAVVLIGFGLGGEQDVTPFLLSRYFGLRALSTLYGVAWTAMGIAGATGPLLMGRAFDTTGSYTGVLTRLAAVTLTSAAVMLALPRYDVRTRAQRVHRDPSAESPAASAESPQTHHSV